MKDLLLDENFDVTDQIGDATDQTTELLVFSVKGSWKKHGGAGVNLVAFAKSLDFAQQAEKRVRLELEVDGAEARRVNFTTQPFEVDAVWLGVQKAQDRELITQVIDNTVLPLPGQTLFDLALQESGSIEAVIQLAHDNNVSITTQLAPDRRVQVSKVVDALMVEYLRKQNVRPLSE